MVMAQKSGRCDLRVNEYTAFCNGPGDVKSPRVIVRRRAHASTKTRFYYRSRQGYEAFVSKKSSLAVHLEPCPSCQHEGLWGSFVSARLARRHPSLCEGLYCQ